MAWMPVAEAAARLGVSERTIWRRIKSDSIPSRSEHGRTLVTLDDVQSASGDPAVGAPFGMLADDDAMSAAIAALHDSRSMCERETKRARGSRRAAWAVAAMLAMILLINGWQHNEKLHNLRSDHAQAITDLQQHNSDALIDVEAKLARTEAASAAQSDELAHLRGASHNERDQVLALESARDDLQCVLEERLDALTASLDSYMVGDLAWDAERDELATTATDLRSTLAQQQSIHQAVLTQQERIIATLRRHAARSAGLAEGYRLHIDLQQHALARARAELDELHSVLAQAPGAADALHDLALRRSLRQSVLGESMLGGAADDQVATANRSAAVAAPFDGYSHFMTGMRKWLAAWLMNGDPQETDATLARMD